MIYQYQCPYCKGRGYHYLERGCSLTYICEDCKGSGELARCDNCGDKCAVSDINLDGLCPECAEKEENERLERERKHRMTNKEFDDLAKAFQNQQDFDEKSFYDKVILPKVKVVYELCKEHNIPAIWQANPRSHGDDRSMQCFATGSLDRLPLQFLLAHHLISAFTPKLATALAMVLKMMDDIPDPEQELPKIED